MVTAEAVAFSDRFESPCSNSALVELCGLLPQSDNKIISWCYKKQSVKTYSYLLVGDPLEQHMNLMET